MSLPQAAMSFLNENADSNSAGHPAVSEDLFKLGALDSVALVDFVILLEEHCGISIPEADVSPNNFRTLEAIERYVAGRRGEL